MGKKKSLNFKNEKVIEARLGIRLKRLFLPLDFGTIDDMLKTLGYRDIERISNQQINASKSDTAFYVDSSRLVFGFNTRNVEKLFTAQKDFFSLAEREYHTKLSEYVRFYEIEYVVNYYGEKNTHDALKKIYSDFNSISSFESITGHELTPKGIDFVSKNDPLHGDRLYHLIIEPKVEAANTVYFCRILYRDNSQNNVLSYLKKCSDVITKSIQKLEQ